VSIVVAVIPNPPERLIAVHADLKYCSQNHDEVMHSDLCGAPYRSTL